MSKGGLAAFASKGKIPNLALETNIGDKAVHILGVNARRVGGIGVTIGVAVFAVEEINEVVAIVHVSDLSLLLLLTV
jgi:hypothetical protein